MLDAYSYAVDVEDWQYENLRSSEPRVDSEARPL